jgi:hypothetical protein
MKIVYLEHILNGDRGFMMEGYIEEVDKDRNVTQISIIDKKSHLIVFK